MGTNNKVLKQDSYCTGYKYIPILYFPVPAVVDVTIGFPADQPEPTLMDAIAGKKITCSMIAK